MIEAAFAAALVPFQVSVERPITPLSLCISKEAIDRADPDDYPVEVRFILCILVMFADSWEPGYVGTRNWTRDYQGQVRCRS